MLITARDLAKLGAIQQIEILNEKIREIKTEIKRLQKIANGQVYRQSKPKSNKTIVKIAKHWTQTPKGRQRMSEIAKERYKKLPSK